MVAKRLVNEFSWSFTRQSTFQECQKKYWYIYYGAWEGWPKTPYDSRKEIDPLAAYLYAMKQMQHLPMFVGSCVHKSIEQFLKESEPSKNLSSLDTLIQASRDLFYHGIEDAKNGTWRKSPKKHANLFEVYYRKDGEQEPLSQAVIKNAEEKIDLSLRNWYSSPIVQQMAFNTKAKWLGIEQLGNFLLHDEEMNTTYKIIVVIDFALRWASGQNGDVAILFDWKTGEESEKTEDQLYSYALFANRVWKFAYDKIILAPFYVFKNIYSKIGFQQEKTLSEEKLASIQDKMLQSSRLMVAKLAPGQDPEIKPDPREFSYTEQRSKCERCPFKELCQKAEYQTLDRESLRELVQPSELALR
jgi:hypothetical protein